MGNYNIPEDEQPKSKDLGSVPLPRTEDMPKWMVVIVITAISAVFGYLILSYNQRVADLKDQNDTCQENYNKLMDKFVFERDKAAYFENQNLNMKKNTDSAVRAETKPYTNTILNNENTN